MRECTGHRYLHNGEFKACSSFDPCNLQEGFSVYEVIRVIEGKYLFLDDHLERLQSSLAISRRSAELSKDELSAQLTGLVKANGLAHGNVKLVLNFRNGHLYCTMMYFIPHRYPSADEYIQGVALAARRMERKEPHRKIWRHSFREQVNQLTGELGVYDILMVNDQGMITEASKANIFLIRSGKVFTPPLSEVLPGITRKYIFRICREQDIPLGESPIPFSELGRYESGFITGTSPKVLPVARIDDYRMNADHPVSRRLAKSYDKLIRQHLDQYPVDLLRQI